MSSFHHFVAVFPLPFRHCSAIVHIPLFCENYVRKFRSVTGVNGKQAATAVEGLTSLTSRPIRGTVSYSALASHVGIGSSIQCLFGVWRMTESWLAGSTATQTSILETFVMFLSARFARFISFKIFDFTCCYKHFVHICYAHYSTLRICALSDWTASSKWQLLTLLTYHWRRSSSPVQLLRINSTLSRK